MTKNSRVTKITPNGTWEGQYGLMHKYDIEMENGDKGEYLSKHENQDKFTEGKEAEYDFIDGNFPKIKPVSTFTPFPSGNNSTKNKRPDNVQEMIVKQSSLKAAVDICIAQGTYSAEDILSRAEAFTDWVMDKNQVKGMSFVDDKTPF